MCDFEINGVLVTKLRVVDLKEELEARGLSKSGKKDELIARLVSYLEVKMIFFIKIVYKLSRIFTIRTLNHEVSLDICNKFVCSYQANPDEATRNSLTEATEVDMKYVL